LQKNGQASLVRFFSPLFFAFHFSSARRQFFMVSACASMNGLLPLMHCHVSQILCADSFCLTANDYLAARVVVTQTHGYSRFSCAFTLRSVRHALRSLSVWSYGLQRYLQLRKRQLHRVKPVPDYR
jgi:hypothetical protein